MIFEVKAIIRDERANDVLQALHVIEHLPGITLSSVRGHGRTHAPASGAPGDYADASWTKVEVVVPETLVAAVVEAIERAARTGRRGDGMLFVIPVAEAVKIWSGARGEEALR